MSQASKPAVPCDRCSTTGGYIPPRKDRVKPVRYRAEKYGQPGEFCQSCFDKIQYMTIQLRELAAADHSPTTPERASRPLYEPTQAEITRGRSIRLCGTPWMARRLPILNPEFSQDELGPRAVVALIRREQKQRRASA